MATVPEPCDGDSDADDVAARWNVLRTFMMSQLLDANACFRVLPDADDVAALELVAAIKFQLGWGKG